MKYTIKPCVNGSSIEIEVNDEVPGDLTNDEVKNIFIYWYAFLQKICDVKEPIEKEKIRYNANGEPLPSERQYELMSNFNIKFDNETTRAQATQLIKESHERFKKEQKK